jgi:hypothetical protein
MEHQQQELEEEVEFLQAQLDLVAVEQVEQIVEVHQEQEQTELQTQVVELVVEHQIQMVEMEDLE